MRSPLPALLAIISLALPLAAQDKDAAKSALDSARKAAKEEGIDMPEIKQEDLEKLIKKAAEELGKVKDKDKKELTEKAEKLVQDASAPNVRIEKLPEWIPAIAGFTPGGPGRQWEGEKFDNGKIKGTSTAKPAALVEAWLALDGKGFSAERNTRTVEKVVTERVRLTKAGEPNVWAEFSASPGATGEPTQVRVVYSQPAPKDRPAAKPVAKPAE